MPQIRKPSRIDQPLNNNVSGKVVDNEIKAVSKVDLPKSSDGSSQGGKEKQKDAVGPSGEAPSKSTGDKLNNVGGEVKPGRTAVESAKTSESSGGGDGGGGGGGGSSCLPVKDKKVKFAETKPSDVGTDFRKSYHVPKSEKLVPYYPSFKGKKGILPVPQPPELFVPPVGEIAVITDVVPDNAISACLPCLEANGTYICTPCNPRCFIIQKVTTSPTGSVTALAPSPPPAPVSLNPNADAFESNDETAGEQASLPSLEEETAPQVKTRLEVPGPDAGDQSWRGESDFAVTDESYAYMNGDVGKLPPGVVYSSTPDPLGSTTADYSTLNGVKDVDHFDGGEGAGAGPGGPAVPSPPAGGIQDANGIPLEQLKQMLSSQLEYYFSRENLANDAYLISQMDNDQYVPIWTVANFNQVKKLTTDIKLITEVLRESPNVQVDEEGQKVRPNHKRCIVILREIPDSTPLEEVKNLFSGEGCPRLISCEFAHNNSWYVTFESDEDAQRAYRFLREEVKEFQGKPIMARIKAKPMNRLPLPPVSGGGLGPMKNGYRTPPAAYDPNAGPFQAPPPNPGAQQRFLYANGSSIPTTVNYGNQVHVYTFQQPNQPFYPPAVLPWAAANNCYFDIGSVFSVNGLAPQQSFAKPSNARFVPRMRNKRPQGNERAKSESSNAGLTRHHMTVGMGPVAVGMPVPVVTKTLSNQNTAKPIAVVEHNHSKSQSQQHSPNIVHIHPHAVNESADTGMTSSLSEPQDSFKQNKDNKLDGNAISFNADRHRRRRKEEDALMITQTQQQQQQQQNNSRSSSIVASNSNKQNLPTSNSPLSPSSQGQAPVQGQFDLEANAFPPLPGIEAGISTVVKAVPVEGVPYENNSPAQAHWGENRLADVVKGTAKPKSNSSTKDKDDGGNSSPRPSSPTQLPQTPTPTPAAVSPVVKSSTGTATDIQEKPSRTALASSQTSQMQQTISMTTQSQQTSQIEITASKSDKEVALRSCDASVATNSNILTPPPSPIKCVVPVPKCTTADKSTKTDDILLNGESEKSESQTAPIKPSTTNAATMTISNAVETDSSVGNNSSSSQLDLPPRLSYAQVTQHQNKDKGERMTREKQNSESEKERKKEINFNKVVGDKKDGGEGFREIGIRSSGRAGTRQSQGTERQVQRRREGGQSDRVPRTRELQPRPRSPK